MKMRWFVIEVSDDREDCIIVGNCVSTEMARKVTTALREQSSRTFKTIGPITQNMLDGKLNPEDLALAEAEMERNEYQQSGGQTH